MERIIRLHIEKLPAGVYLATSDDVQGLVGQGDSVAHVIEFARNAARILAEIKAGHGIVEQRAPLPDAFDHYLVLAA